MLWGSVALTVSGVVFLLAVASILMLGDVVEGVVVRNEVERRAVADRESESTVFPIVRFRLPRSSTPLEARCLVGGSTKRYSVGDTLKCVYYPKLTDRVLICSFRDTLALPLGIIGLGVCGLVLSRVVVRMERAIRLRRERT